MNKAILEKIAKAKKINLKHFDEVFGWVNEKYTYIIISFACRENVGGNAYHLCRKDIKLSVAAINKREEFVEDYTTNGWKWIWEIK